MPPCMHKRALCLVTVPSGAHLRLKLHMSLMVWIFPSSEHPQSCHMSLSKSSSNSFTVALMKLGQSGWLIAWLCHYQTKEQRKHKRPRNFLHHPQADTWAHYASFLGRQRTWCIALCPKIEPLEWLHVSAGHPTKESFINLLVVLWVHPLHWMLGSTVSENSCRFPEKDSTMMTSPSLSPLCTPSSNDHQNPPEG